MSVEHFIPEERKFPDASQDDTYPVVVIIADGWTRSVFSSLLEAGDLEGIREQIIVPGGLLTDVISNVPSVSIASHASILTSHYQDDHWLPGHRWQDRDTGACHNYLTLRGPRKANADLNPSVPTIFESHPNATTLSVQSVISRGADVTSRLPSMRSGPILKRAANLIAQNPKSVTVAWLPRVDAMAHLHGPNSKQAREEIVESSIAIGDFVKTLGRLGLLEAARILLVPDHGQREVQTSINLRELIESTGLDAKVNPRRFCDADVVAMTSGDSAAHIYSRTNRSSNELAERLLSRQGIELICWMNDGQANFRSPTGLAVASWEGEAEIAYRVTEDNDPLGLGIASGTTHYFDVSDPIIAGKYPDLLHQYIRSNVDGRSGQILVLAPETSHFGTGPRFGYRMGYHKGTHGGPFAAEVLVSAAFRGVELKENAPVRSADLLRRLGMLAEVGFSHVVNC